MEEKTNLHILWANADITTSLQMVMMYATNAKLRDWWDTVTVIIWGATAKLTAENKEIQEAVKKAQQAGVKFSACIACAKNLGVNDELEALDIEVIAWGVPLTQLLQSNAKLLTV